MKQKKYTFYALMFTLLCILYTLLFPYEIASNVRSALRLCASYAVPSLFIFIILTRLLCVFLNDIALPEKLSHAFEKLFHLPSNLFAVCMLGIFCGAPSSCFGIASACETGRCTREQAQAAAAFSNNCSFSFILGIVSSFFCDTKAAYIILFSNLLANFTVYFLFFRPKAFISCRVSALPKSRLSLSGSVTKAISSTSLDVLAFCSYIVFFYTLSRILSARICIFLQKLGMGQEIINVIRAFITGIFELTSGVFICSEANGCQRIILLCFCTSFLGISIFMQVKHILEMQEISSRCFILSKILCSIISPVYAGLILLFTNTNAHATAATGGKNMTGFTVIDLTILVFATSLCFIGAKIISKFDKK